MNMTVFGFRPSLWPTLIALPAVAFTFGLGLWQVQRLAWKETLIAERQSRMTLPVLRKLPVNLESEQLLFRRVRFTGQFLQDREMYHPARSLLAGAIGVQVITPFRLVDGGVLLVNRGWVPKVRQNPETRRDGQVQGDVTLVGVIRMPARAGYFVPENDPVQNVWFRINISQMAMHADIKDMRPYYVDLVDDAPGGWPKGGQTRVTVRNSHLEYAITWFSISLTGLIIYVLWHRRYRPAPNRQPAGPGAA